MSVSVSVSVSVCVLASVFVHMLMPHLYMSESSL